MARDQEEQERRIMRALGSFPDTTALGSTASRNEETGA